IIDTMLDGVIVLDNNYNILDINEATKRILPTVSFVLGEKLDHVIPHELMVILLPLIHSSSKEPQLLHYVDKVFDVHVTTLVEFGGVNEGHLIMLHDVSERENLHRQVRESALLDPLTQILNRKALFEQVDKERIRILGSEGTLSLIMMDIDHFKEINDTYGHEAGDRAIEKLVEVVAHILGSEHLFGRYGGDEFVVALIDVSFDKMLEIARLIHLQVTSTLIVSRRATFSMKISLGAVTFGDKDNYPIPSSTDGLVALVDSALYKAKEEGRNKVAFVHPRLGKKIDPQLELEGLGDKSS
ncbi:MAG: sensor domain-containing diguanylate cyclase, partial [Spirochaetia bacterium]|nr:sensor domain-containing diguanylate cyclase [Spirochaetia bacterium]